MNRRKSLKLLVGAAGAMTTATLIGRSPVLAQAPAAPAPPAGPFKLPPLGYAYNALEPNIDEMTMTIHHTRHHQAFITGLNGLVGKFEGLGTMAPEAILSDLSKVPETIRTPVRNQLGGHWNHTFFWDLMTPGGPKEPTGDLKAAIDRDFKSPSEMMEKLNAAGLGRFGSGWAWLVVKDKKLDIVNTPYQDTPHMDLKATPVVGVDVWEHAYYLKYQNRRGDYLKAWWNTVNWAKAGDHYKKAMA